MLLPSPHAPGPDAGRSSLAHLRAARNRRFAAAVTLCGLSLLLIPFLAQAQAQPATFADPAFKALWDRTDGLVASGATRRAWVWGPAPGASLQEPFVGFPNNRHLVQYFDKGRMEINDPGANKNDPFYVTNGRLAIELISGQAQVGSQQFQDLKPAQINLASDADDPSAPTYGSFNGVSNLPGTGDARRAPNRLGTIVRTAIDRQGNTQPWPADHLDYGVKIAHYEESTGHNIPDVFWNYLNEQGDIVQEGQQVKGPLFYPWFAVTGLPISEPYWSYVKVEGKYRDVLAQAYERRVLTYVPVLPTPFKVQMGNIGQHYYEWRYGKGNTQGTPRPPVATPTSQGPPPRANVTIDEIAYRKSLIDINGTYCTLTNRGSTPVLLDGWRLDSPKWGIVDVFYFPNGVRIAPGASIKVHSGPGNNTSTDIYMSRTTVMWEGQPYDYAVLYDNFARQVSDFFPAGDVGKPPTPPASEASPTPGGPSGTATPTRPSGGTTTTPTVPSPKETVPTGVATSTPTRTATGSGTPRTATATATATRPPQGNCTDLIRNGGFESRDLYWIAGSGGGLEIINGELPHSGTLSAVLAGYHNAQDVLYQVVTIPATARTADLNYWRLVASEDGTGADHDFMYVEVRTESNGLLGTLETVTNRATNFVWDNRNLSVLAYKGQTVRIQFRSTSDGSLLTAFDVDDVRVNVCP